MYVKNVGMKLLLYCKACVCWCLIVLSSKILIVQLRVCFSTIYYKYNLKIDFMLILLDDLHLQRFVQFVAISTNFIQHDPQ